MEFNNSVHELKEVQNKQWRHQDFELGVDGGGQAGARHQFRWGEWWQASGAGTLWGDKGLGGGGAGIVCDQWLVPPPPKALFAQSVLAPMWQAKKENVFMGGGAIEGQKQNLGSKCLHAPHADALSTPKPRPTHTHTINYAMCLFIALLIERGVVQLFNAVRKQQKTREEKLKEVGGSQRKRAKVEASLTKGDFLDMLKGTPAPSRSDGSTKDTKPGGVLTAKVRLIRTILFLQVMSCWCLA